jgi:4-hydroxyphenylacetate 3-monooxygenase
VPWENVFVYGDVERMNGFAVGSGFLSRAMLQGCARFSVKLDFLAGLFLKAVEMVGSKDQRNVQVAVGEVLIWANVFHALTDGMIEGAVPWVGDTVQPPLSYMHTYRMVSVNAYARIKELMEQTLGSSLIYLVSGVEDLKSPEIRPYIDRFVRGSEGRSAIDRIKLLKLVWDSLGSEFGGRHELYERNYAGNWENVRFEALMAETAIGRVDALKGFVDQCLADYDIDGWIAPGYTNPSDVSVHGPK